MGGQWPMILSGALSTIAGPFFILQASALEPTLTSLTGYAVLGGTFFLVSCLGLGRDAQVNWPDTTTHNIAVRGRRPAAGRTPSTQATSPPLRQPPNPSVSRVPPPCGPTSENHTGHGLGYYR